MLENSSKLTLKYVLRCFNGKKRRTKGESNAGSNFSKFVVPNIPVDKHATTIEIIAPKAEYHKNERWYKLRCSKVVGLQNLLS